MSSFNKVILMGNLTRDPELRYTASNAAICQFGLATNRKIKMQDGQERDEATFVEITVFGRQGENCSKYLKKGSGVHIDGRLKYEAWTDKNTGQNRSKLSVTGEFVQFLPKPASSQDQQPQYQSQQQPQYQSQQQPQYQPPQQPQYQQQGQPLPANSSEWEVPDNLRR